MTRDEDEVNRLAKVIAHETVKEILLKLGVNPDEPVEVQKDFAFLRSLRETSSDLTRHGLKAILAVLCAGVLALIYSSIKTGKLP